MGEPRGKWEGMDEDLRLVVEIALISELGAAYAMAARNPGWGLYASKVLAAFKALFDREPAMEALARADRS